MNSDTVCVVGAGPAGLVTAKVFLDDGFDVTVYEKYDEVGGTWSSNRRYVNLTHQLGRGIFEFSDMPRDRAFEDAESIQSYLQRYTDRFGIRERTQFETEIVSLAPAPDGWTVEHDNADGTTDQTRFDYVVVCSGMHHIPNLPEVPGGEAFEGVTRHSSQVDEEALFEDERVVVVGGGKSAFDLAVETGRRARETTLVFRKANWMVPKKLLGGLLPQRFILYTRFGESLLPQYYNEACVRPIDRIPGAVKDRLWKLVHWDVLNSGGLADLDDDLVPETELRHDIAHAGVLPDSFADLAESGAITPMKATVEKLESDGVRLDSGDFVGADVVVFATGFRKEIPFLDGIDVKTDDDRFYLYRSLVPPTVENIGFVGTRETFNNILSMEVSAHWLAAYFQEELEEMPETRTMRERIDRRLEWQAATIPDTHGFDFGPYDLHCVDELLVDMGVDTRRSNLLAEYFLPGARARRYAGLGDERKG